MKLTGILLGAVVVTTMTPTLPASAVAAPTTVVVAASALASGGRVLQLVPVGICRIFPKLCGSSSGATAVGPAGR